MCAGASAAARGAWCVGQRSLKEAMSGLWWAFALQAAWGLSTVAVSPCLSVSSSRALHSSRRSRGSSAQGRALQFMLGAVFMTARAPPLLLTSRTPPLDPFRDPFRASREAGLPWWLPQNLQDGLPDDLPASIEQPPPQRVLRASRAASFPRWLSQTEQDGLPDDRPAVTEAAQGSEAPSRLKTAALSLLKRAIFSTSEDGIFSTRLETQPNSQDNQGAARAASAKADAASGAR